MLGTETDLFVIDLISGAAHNLGYMAGIDSATVLIRKLLPKGTAKQRASRFLIISGVELGYNMVNEKTRVCKSLYNKGVSKVGKHFISN